MPEYTVKVGSAEYAVTAPDESTAWQWANAYHAQFVASGGYSQLSSERIGVALKEADAAGNVEDARLLVKAYVFRREQERTSTQAGSSKPTHNALTQYMVDGGVGSATFGAIFVTLLGALAAALVYRLVRGSWRSTSDTRQRRWLAIALIVPISAGVSKLANGALWSDSRDLELALAYFLIWAPLFAAAAYLLAKYLKNGARNAPQAVIPTPSAVINNPPTSTPAPSTPAYIPSNTDPYQQAGQEILSGNVDPAIWARSLVEGAGNESAVKAAYVKLRVAQLNAAKSDV